MFEAPDLNYADPGSGIDTYATSMGSTSKAPTSTAYSDLTYASMGLSAIGSVATAFEGAASARAQGDYEATIARTNASLASLQARQALEAGDIMASRKNMETQQTVGSLKAQQGASGIDVASGSGAAVRAGVVGAGAIDELTIKNNAARTAWGYQTEAIQDTYKGQFAQLTAKAQAQQSILTGGMQAISGPLAIESNYLRFARYMGGGSGGGSSRLPFNLSTN